METLVLHGRKITIDVDSVGRVEMRIDGTIRVVFEHAHAKRVADMLANGARVAKEKDARIMSRYLAARLAK